MKTIPECLMTDRFKRDLAWHRLYRDNLAEEILESCNADVINSESWQHVEAIILGSAKERAFAFLISHTLDPDLVSSFVHQCRKVARMERFVLRRLKAK